METNKYVFNEEKKGIIYQLFEERNFERINTQINEDTTRIIAHLIYDALNGDMTSEEAISQIMTYSSDVSNYVKGNIDSISDQETREYCRMTISGPNVRLSDVETELKHLGYENDSERDPLGSLYRELNDIVCKNQI